MSGIVWLFFESRLALGAVLGIALFVLLVYWRRTGRPRPLLVGLGLAVVSLVLQALVVTQRERASGMLDRIAADLVKSQTAALSAALAADFRAGEMDRREFLDYVRRMQDRVMVRWVERTELRIPESEGSRFVVEAAYLAEIRVDQIQAPFRSRWTLTFARTPAGWQIVNLEPLTVEGVPTATWERLERQ